MLKSIQHWCKLCVQQKTHSRSVPLGQLKITLPGNRGAVRACVTISPAAFEGKPEAWFEGCEAQKAPPFPPKGRKASGATCARPPAVTDSNPAHSHTALEVKTRSSLASLEDEQALGYLQREPCKPITFRLQNKRRWEGKGSRPDKYSTHRRLLQASARTPTKNLCHPPGFAAALLPLPRGKAEPPDALWPAGGGGGGGENSGSRQAWMSVLRTAVAGGWGVVVLPRDARAGLRQEGSPTTAAAPRQPARPVERGPAQAR